MYPIRFSISNFPLILISPSSFPSSHIFESLNYSYNVGKCYSWENFSPIWECFLGNRLNGFFTRIFVLLSTRSNTSLISLLFFLAITFFSSFYISIEFSLYSFLGFIVLLICVFSILFMGILPSLGLFKYWIVSNLIEFVDFIWRYGSMYSLCT